MAKKKRSVQVAKQVKPQSRKQKRKAARIQKKQSRQDTTKRHQLRKKETVARHGPAEDQVALKKLQSDMRMQRKKALHAEIVAEDRTIKQLEKRLKLNKQNVSESRQFVSDGLDYILEMCDGQNIDDYSAAHIDAKCDIGEEFQMLHEHAPNKRNASLKVSTENEEIEESDVSSTDEEEDDGNEEEEEEEAINGSKIVKQDIYGRPLDKNGIELAKSEKYVPPSARSECTSEKGRLQRQLKGLMNRLAESNLHNISTQIEALYMRNSRNDINETLATLLFDALITQTSTPERLLLENGVLIAILHANVGCEVGAYFIQQIAMKFAAVFAASSSIEDKTLDNIINVITQLYNFQICNSQLIFDILDKLSAKFDEKCIECMLNVLRSVGFRLRKDDAEQLHNFVVNLQRQAAVNPEATNNPRVKFMLDILLAIKNNNVSKMPNYDPSHSDHLKKVAKQIIRKGNRGTQLNVGLQDLLQAETNGKWWVVGSAWSGHQTKNQRDENPTTKQTNSQTSLSKELLGLAKEQRMNTITRRNIFCILLSAQDYMDAFEKLLRLGLKNGEEREFINVLLHCCLAEKQYNEFYAILAQKFCDYQRKFQTMLKCAVWDKFRVLTDYTDAQIANMSKLLTFLLLEKVLPITTLKVIEFGSLSSVTVRLMRQIFLGILLTPNEDVCRAIFTNISKKENQLKMFKESIRLFIHHFLLRNIRESTIDNRSQELLLERSKMVDKMLS